MRIQSSLPGISTRVAKPLAVCLCAFFLFPNHALSAKRSSLVSLTPTWRMESDANYSFQADYRAPIPVKGLALHGYFADDALSIENAKASLPATTQCGEPVTVPDPRGLPAYLPERTRTEFWFYRSGDQGLYVSRSWRVERSDQCVVTASIDTKVVHMSLFNGTARFIVTKNGATPTLSTDRIADGESYSIPAEFVAIDARKLRTRSEAAIGRRTDDRLDGTPFRRVCFDTSIAFFFSNRCVLNEAGPWRGLLISANSQADDGTSYSEYGVLDIDPKALMDGRLFEWDRKIVLASAVK